MNEKEQIVKSLKKVFLKNKINLKDEKIENLIEIPPSQEMGDFAFPCFVLAKFMKKNPKDIAIQIRGDIDNKGFEDIQTSGAYINFFVNRKKFAWQLVKQILDEKESFGKPELESEKVMVEFSQPNTHKAFHVGHIRGTSLGESISRILEFAGNKVIRANYSGDTGMHIAKWIWCYKKYHSKQKLKKDESWIASIYVDAVKRLAKNEKLQEQVEEINRKIENKSDKKINELWKKTRSLSIESWKKIYEQLNTFFDVHYFESEVEQKGKEIAEELLKNNIAKKSDGAVIMDLQEYKLGVWVLLRKDNTVLYSAKDLALAEKKFIDFPDLQKSLYLIANEQDLHFKQLVKTLELAKLNYADKLQHFSYGMVRLPTGKMSSRTGENILYSYFIDEMMKYAKKEIKKREPKVSKKELEKRALKISIAAIKYSMLKQGASRNIIFNSKDALNFEGDTGPYILYTYARASSILKKAKKKLSENLEIKNLEEKEIELTKKLSQFPEVVLDAYKNYNPSMIANYSYQLAQIFNEFYHSCPVINSDNESFRLSLLEAFRYVLKNSLNLLGIDTIEKM
ncbi:MAG: arginine--tRNA ligase [Nanoarchaeota archaeon]|nr:arginine--tRNA ligase [Nanoarchaeota archaeon]